MDAGRVQGSIYTKLLIGSVPSDIPTLHGRLRNFQSQNEDIANLLMAVKVFGNYGSHSASGISRADLIGAYDVFEFALKNLLDPELPKKQAIADNLSKKYGN